MTDNQKPFFYNSITLMLRAAEINQTSDFDKSAFLL